MLCTYTLLLPQAEMIYTREMKKMKDERQREMD
jgi:hypothetical protein